MSMDRQAFVRHVGLEVRTLDFWIEQQWLLPTAKADGQDFSDRDVARAHLIADLAGTFGVNDEGIDIVLHLLDQIHGMRATMTQLREGMAQKD